MSTAYKRIYTQKLPKSTSLNHKRRRDNSGGREDTVVREKGQELMTRLRTTWERSGNETSEPDLCFIALSTGV
jgi:hypothetical protein